MDIKLTAQVEIIPQYYDCDPMGIVWHGNYLRFFEDARVALMGKIDFDYPAMDASGFIWPIIDVRVKYIKSALVAQRIRVEAELLEYENRIRVGYLIVDAENGERITKGHTIQVAVNSTTGEMSFVTPKVFLDCLRGA